MLDEYEALVRTLLDADPLRDAVGARSAGRRGASYFDHHALAPASRPDAQKRS
jgi:hypothetical protein